MSIILDAGHLESGSVGQQDDVVPTAGHASGGVKVIRVGRINGYRLMEIGRMNRLLQRAVSRIGHSLPGCGDNNGVGERGPHGACGKQHDKRHQDCPNASPAAQSR
jgi:hypothetical protein